MDNEIKEDSVDGQDSISEQVPTQKQNPQWRPQDADREYIKMSTRKRVRNATVPANAIFKPAKPAPTINDTGNTIRKK